MKKYVVLEVERISGHIIKKVIRNISSTISYQDFVDVVRNNEGTIERIDYNNEINQIRNKIADAVDREFYNVESGDYSNYEIFQYDNSNNRYKHIRKGFLCEFNINSLQKSTLFGNLGPNIPMKLSFIGYSYSDILIEIKNYGINNALIEVWAVIDVNMVVSMPVSSDVVSVQIKEPLIKEIIQGEIPNYFING